MTTRTSKKPAKAAPKRSKANGKPQTAKDTAPANGTIPEQPEVNGAATEPKSRPPQRKPPVPYSDDIAEHICDRLRNGESLNSI
jgi:hypothetical protein